MKRNQIVDQDTGRVDLRYNPMSVEEDYYIPVRAGQSSRIENLPGGQFTGDIDDVNYLRDKLFSAIKIPKAYLAQTDAAEDKTTLAQKDIRFARTIQRLQRVVLAEVQKICIVHLFTLGYRNEDLLNFNLTLNNPSKIAELQELEHLRTKFDIAGAATEGLFSNRWVYKHIFKLDDDAIERIMREQFTDSRHRAVLEASGVAAAEQTSGGPSGGEGDFGDEEGLGAEADALSTDAAGDAEEPAPDEGPLLAEPETGEGPGQRDDSYEPVVSDQRRSGARKRSALASAGEKAAYPGRERLFKGMADGLSPLSRGVVSAGIKKSDEALITETQQEIKSLIDQLEKRDESETQ